MAGQTHIKDTITTDNYPIRYEAFEHERVMVVNGGDIVNGGGEVAWYWAPTRNSVYDKLTDGVHAEAHTLHPAVKRGIYAEVRATRPDGTRHQKGWSKQFKVSNEMKNKEAALRYAALAAIAWMRETIPKAHAWMARPTHEVLRETAAWNLEEAGRVHGPFAQRQAAMFRMRAEGLYEMADVYESLDPGSRGPTRAEVRDQVETRRREVQKLKRKVKREARKLPPERWSPPATGEGA